MAHLGAQEKNRMCICCRQVSPSTGLLRFVCAPDGSLVFDVRGRAESRGAYTCANTLCLSRAVQKRAFSRAFEDAVAVVEQATLFDEVRNGLKKRILENLGLALRASQCVLGRTRAQGEITLGRAIALMVADDLSARSCRDLGVNVNEGVSGIPVLVGPCKELTGQALGKLETGVVALLKGRISDRIICDLKRFQALCGYSRVGE